MDLTATETYSFISRYSNIFWDFDGVIKDSLGVKSRAFYELFRPFGEDIAVEIVQHHEKNGGVSRFEKIPIYLEWSGITPEKCSIQHYCDKFSELVVEAVINSNWVDGVYDFIKSNYCKHNFFLVSATPQEEIEFICEKLNLTDNFLSIHGSPYKKFDVVSQLLLDYECQPSQALFIGDAVSDMSAAQSNGIEFLLKKTVLNSDLQHSYNGPKWSSIANESACRD